MESSEVRRGFPWWLGEGENSWKQLTAGEKTESWEPKPEAPVARRAGREGVRRQSSLRLEGKGWVTKQDHCLGDKLKPPHL